MYRENYKEFSRRRFETIPLSAIIENIKYWEDKIEGSECEYDYNMYIMYLAKGYKQLHILGKREEECIKKIIKGSKNEKTH